MGFLTETLRLVVDADTAGAVRGVEKFGDTAQREMGKAEGSLDKWGGRLTTVGAGMIGFGTAALFGLGKAAAASEEAHLSVVKLENTLGNMPKLAGENSKQFVELAESIQDVTAADADAIVEGQALLGTFNLTAKEIKGITPLVVDYARKFGIDIPDAAIQVGKALDGQVGALKRNGVSIDEVLFKTDRYAAVQEALSDQVGGFAEQEGKTFAGSLERLKNQMGDLVEGVGVGAVDAFSTMFDAVDPLVDRFSEMDPATASLIGKVAAFGSVAVIAAGGASILIGQVMTMHERFSTAADAARRLAGSDGLAKLGSAAAVAAIEIGILLAANEAINKLFPEERANIDRLENSLLKLGDTHRVSGELAKIMGDDLGELKEAIDHVIDPSGFQELEHVLEEVSSGGGLIDAGEGIEDFEQRIDDLDKALARLATRDPAAAAAGLEALIAKLGLSGDEADRFVESLDDYDAALASADTSNRVAGDGIDGTTAAMRDQAEEADLLSQAIQEYQNQVNAMFDPQVAAADALGKQQEALRSVREAQDALNVAVAEHGPVSAEAAAAQAELSQAQTDARDAVIDLDIAAQALREEVSAHPGALEEARRSLIDMAMAQGFSAIEAAALADQLGLATGAVLNLDAAPDPTIHMGVTGYDETHARLANILAAVRAIPFSKEIHMGVTGYGGRARGGPVEEGMPVWVGENRRPELFIPNNDGHIYTEDQVVASGAMSRGGGGPGWGGGSSVTVLELRSSGSPIDDFLVEVLRKAIRVQGGDVQLVLGRN